MNIVAKFLAFFWVILFMLLLNLNVFGQSSAPALEGTVLLIKPNTSQAPEAVRDNLLSLEVCCYLGYENASEEHILLISAPGASVAQAHNTVMQAYPNATIEELSAEAWFERIGYRMLVTGEKVPLNKQNK
jgi:hypothetical protein